MSYVGFLTTQSRLVTLNLFQGFVRVGYHGFSPPRRLRSGYNRAYRFGYGTDGRHAVDATYKAARVI